ncbi:MAG: hypothetical protein N3B12_04030 [Armatimonadetes bacterium]|nr:hypothetical protein [Armatimonadota bacterium]
MGLLVRTFGQVLDHTVNGFVIDDGSNVPLRVVYSGTLPDVTTFVVVDGISSLQLVGSNVERLLLATSWE